jgi:hypothetical protein
VQLLNELRAGTIGAQWCGRANTLSPKHGVEWPVIDEVAQATRRSESAPITEDFSRFPTEEQLFGIPVRHGLLTAETAILGRRSAVAMDGSTAISQEAFFRTTYGAAFYRNLFWEAGMVGQVLYLEAEETGIRSTGIGCYFDDPVHEVFGITSPQWQSFYHFTVGGQVEDTRLTTLPSYDFEEEQMSAPTSSSTLRAKALPGYRGASNSYVTAWCRSDISAVRTGAATADAG